MGLEDKYEVQEAVFVRWGNSLLANEPLREFRDLAELKYISSVTHIVTGGAVPLTGNRIDGKKVILWLETSVNRLKGELGPCPVTISPIAVSIFVYFYVTSVLECIK